MDQRDIAAQKDTPDDLLHRCWRHQECGECLNEDSCSWCPTTTSCIPNNYTVQILAPFWNPDICPLWSERWELRTRTFGCHVSTITFLTCLVSVLSTFVVIGIVVMAVKATRAVRAIWHTRSAGWWRFWEHHRSGWWKGWKLVLVDIRDEEANEQRPLLNGI